MSQVYDEPIVVRLTQPVGPYPVGTEFGFKDVADAIRALGSASYFEVVRTQDGDPIPPPTPEDMTEAEKQALARARAARLIRGAEFDPLVPGPGEVIVGTADGPVAVKRDMMDPPSSVARLLPAPPVMANPPTIGELRNLPGGSSPSPTLSVIPNARRVLAGESSAFRFFGGAVAAGNGWESPSRTGRYITSLNATPYVRLDFEADCSQIELMFKGNSQGVHIMVDGEYITESPLAMGGAGGPTAVPLTFASRGVRRFTVICQWFWGVFLGPNDELWRSSYPLGPRVIVMGDSFTEGPETGIQRYNLGFPIQTGRLLGWNDTWPSGSGGTGYTTNGSITGRFTFGERVDADVNAYDPDIVLVAGGINDSAATPAALNSAADDLFAKIRTGSPNATLLVLGPFHPTGSPNAGRIQHRDAIREAALDAGALFIDNIGGPVPYSGDAADYVNKGWITGTGRVGATTGSGNADLYTSSDATHPTIAGHAYIARRLASAIASVFA